MTVDSWGKSRKTQRTEWKQSGKMTLRPFKKRDPTKGMNPKVKEALFEKDAV